MDDTVARTLVLSQQFVGWANHTEAKVLGFFLEEGGFAHRPLDATTSFPLTRLYEALAIVAAYLVFVVVGGLWQLSPLGLKLDLFPLRFVYNLAQVILCSYMSVEAALLAYRNDYTLVPCAPFNVDSPVMSNLLWLFYVSKILDFLDTVFIVSAKKWSQLSFLHVYHHATVFILFWLNMRLGYDGDIFLTIILNAFVHSVMYTYYFVSMHTKNIWWKRYLTATQMVQFCVMLAQMTFMLQVQCDQYPTRITKLFLGYVFSLLVLFLHFFVTSGTKRGGKGSDMQNDKKQN